MSIYPSLKGSELSNHSFSNTPQKKVLYFSDGTLEVDENEQTDSPKMVSASSAVNPQELTWVPWMWHQTVTAGSKALEVCDYLGESLASFFGITTPKYQFEINEYNRIKKEEEEEAAKNDIEMGSWNKKYSSEETECGVTSGQRIYSSTTENNFARI